MPLLRLTGLAALAATLAACSGSEVNRARLFTADPAPVIAPRSSTLLSPEELKQIAASGNGMPLMLAQTEDRRTMSFSSSTGGAQAVWNGPGGQRMILENDEIVGTASMGSDLVQADRPRTPVQERVGQTYVRSYHHNTPEQIVVTNFDCAMEAAGNEDVMILEASYSTTRLVENCDGPGGASFENAYWVDEGGSVRQSRQWVSDEIGTIEMLRLIQ